MINSGQRWNSKRINISGNMSRAPQVLTQETEYLNVKADSPISYLARKQHPFVTGSIGNAYVLLDMHLISVFSKTMKIIVDVGSNAVKDAIFSEYVYDKCEFV